MSWFKDKEFFCRCGRPECDAPKQPHPLLLSKLELARAYYGQPMRVTSGARCPTQNAAVGGKPDSTHLTATGADIACSSSRDRWQMLAAFGMAGFRRLGIGKGFVHVDVAADPAHPLDVVWTYYP